MNLPAAACTSTEWPMASDMPPLGALATAPACARALAGSALAAWNMLALADEGELIVSEFVTNAVRASADEKSNPRCVAGLMPMILVRLLTNGELLRIEVRDQASGVPALRDPTDADETGRGLLLVDTITGGRSGSR